jgi:hypothetical protein
MAQQISTQMRVPTDVETAYAMVTDPAYARDRAERTAGRDIEVAASGDPATVVSKRTLPVPEELPSFARAMVGDGIAVEETHAWQAPSADGSREARLVVLFPSMPVKVEGTMRIAADGDGCMITIEATANASMPMVGGVVEQGVKAQVLRAAQEEERLANEWLARA